MPLFKSQDSKSLQQQHQQHHQQLQNNLHHRFRLSNVLGDPFALSTISIGSIGWVIALTGSITISTTSSRFPVFTWWGIASEFLVIISVFWISATNNAYPYRLALLAALATTTVYTTNSTNNFVYTSSPTSAAASAGYILLSIINVLWILYFGTTEEAALHRIIDSYAVNKPFAAIPSTTNPAAPTPQTNPLYRDSSAYATTPGTQILSNQQKHSYYAQGYAGQPQSFMAAPLGAFENSSQLHHSRSFNGRAQSTASQAFRPSSSANPQSFAAYAGYRASAASTADRTSAGDIIATPTEYPYRVRANYSYEAADHNELSFFKDEILEVSDISGKWWQARKDNGEIGICPSNYVTLLKSDGSPYQYENPEMSSTMTSTTTTTTTTGYQNL